MNTYLRRSAADIVDGKFFKLCTTQRGNSQDSGTICWGHMKHMTSIQITEEADWIVGESFVQKFIS